MNQNRTKKVLVSVFFRGRSKWSVVDAQWDGRHAYVPQNLLDSMAGSLGAKLGDTYNIG